jgi:hypothetical protein
MTTYRLMDGASGRPGVGSSGTQPPAAVTAFSGNYIAGLVFKVTSPGLWLNGYWWWVPGNGPTAPQKFALWQVTGSPGGTLVSGMGATSAALTAGQFNFVPREPVQLTAGTVYAVSVGFSTTIGFPDTTHQFGAGNPYAAGITNGPLYGFHSGETNAMPQQPFSTASADPNTTFPATNDLDDLLWVDVSVTDTPVTAATERIWPNSPPFSQVPNYLTGPDSSVIATEFSVSAAATLTNIWHYSPTGATLLPTRASIWKVAGTSTVVDVTSPTWSGAAGSGWIRCTNLPAFTLAAATRYKVSTYQAVGGATWFEAANAYWSDDITNGILKAYSNANASAPGQGTFNLTTFTYPATTNGEGYFVDVEVTPVPAAIGGNQLQAGRTMLRKRLLYADL